MKLLILISSLLVVAFSAPSPPFDGKIHIPEKCEDVLAVKVCKKLEETATNLKLTTDQVKAAIINAVKNGLTKSEDIYKSAKDFLQQKVLSKKCEDFTTADTCSKLRALAAKLKVESDKVEKFVIQAIADGAVQASDLYNKVVEYYKNEVSTKTCEDFLTKSQCERIRQVASALKIKSDTLEKTIVDAITKAYIEGKDALQGTFEQLKDLAKNTSCEDLLNPDVCAGLRKYANLTKVAFPKIMEVVLDSIVKGYKLGKGLLKFVYDVTDYFYDCEDVFTKTSCDRLKYWLSKVGVKVTEIDQIVREYAKKGIATATELYTKIYAYLQDKVICKIDSSCSSSLMVKRSIDFDWLKNVKENLEKAIVKAHLQIQEHLAKVGLKVKDASEKMKKAIEEQLLKMKMKAADVAKVIQELFKKKSINGATAVRITKRDIYQQLKEAFMKAHGHIKSMIQKLMTMSKEHLKSVHLIVKSILNQFIGDGKTKREIHEIDMFEQIVEEMIADEFKEVEKEAEINADVIIDEVILEDGDNVEDVMVEKRDLTAIVNKMKGAYKNLGDKFKQLLEKMKGIDVTKMKEMLENAGSKMLGSVKDLYEKIKAMLQQQQQLA